MRWLSKPLVTLDDEGGDVVLMPSSRAGKYVRADSSRMRFDKLLGHPLDDLISDTLDLLALTPMGMDMANRAITGGYSAEFVCGDNDILTVDAVNKCLYLPDFNLTPDAIARSSYFSSAFMFNLMRGLRLITQIENGALQDDLSPDQAILQSRISAADACAAALYLAYELKDEEPVLWRYLLSSSYGDMALRFSKGFAAMDKSGEGMAATDRALSAALILWYRDSSRICRVDHDTLSRLDDVLIDIKNPSFLNQELTDDMICAICTKEDGASYLSKSSLLALRSPVCESIMDDIIAAHLDHIRREQDVVIVNNVAFRDNDLARLIFPDA